MCVRHSALLALCLTALSPAIAYPGDRLRVDGYFCDSRKTLLAFMHEVAASQNEITASNAVNKATGKASCMPHYLADVEIISEQTVLDDGITVVLRSFRILSDDVERWHGVTSGAYVPAGTRSI